MLVQHFLKIIALNPGKFTNPFKPPTPSSAMKVDGKFGPVTANWITAFQQHRIRIGKHIFSDSCVDKIFNRQRLSPNGFLWTLFMLNVAMGQVTEDELWDEWWNDESVPALLRDRVRDPASFF